jgi:hypothetical protein
MADSTNDTILVIIAMNDQSRHVDFMSWQNPSGKTPCDKRKSQVTWPQDLGVAVERGTEISPEMRPPVNSPSVFGRDRVHEFF